MYVSSLVSGYEQLYRSLLLHPALNEATQILPVQLFSSVFQGNVAYCNIVNRNEMCIVVLTVSNIFTVTPEYMAV